MQINSISFGNLSKTKNGNLYEKKNTYKNIGTIAGLAGGGAIALTSTNASLLALELSAKLAGKKHIAKIPNIMKAVLVGGVLLLGLAGRLLGAIPDSMINRSRRNKADNV